jgi:hypothetical protein
MAVPLIAIVNSGTMRRVSFCFCELIAKCGRRHHLDVPENKGVNRRSRQITRSADAGGSVGKVS